MFRRVPSLMDVHFISPLEDEPPTLAELMARAWLEADSSTIESFIREGRVTVDDRILRDPARKVREGLVLTATLPPVDHAYGIPEAPELARGEGWVFVDKPVGMPGSLDRSDPMNPVLFMADVTGLDRDAVELSWPMPIDAGGPWPCAVDASARDRLVAGWSSGRTMLTFVAIAPRLSMSRGVIPGVVPVGFAVTRMEGPLCEVQLTPQYVDDGSEPVDPVTLVCDALRRQGAPAIGDRQRGGLMAEGGLRVRLQAIMDDALGMAHSWNPGRAWWPVEPLLAPQEEPELPEAQRRTHIVTGADPELSVRSSSEGIRTLMVSSKTLEVLGGGHPWVLEDADTGGRGHFANGEVVQLQDPRGALGPWALASRAGSIAAFVWSEDELSATDFRGEVDLRVDEAVLARDALVRDSSRNSLYRLIHGEGDGLPGLYLDRVGPLLRATITSPVTDAYREYVYDNLAEFDPRLTVLEVHHLRDVRAARLPRASLVRGAASSVRDDGRVVGVEDGLKYWCEPWEGVDTGFFADQRENRRKLLQIVQPGQRWLNLFGHTGAFSVALASRGATVTNVDVSKRYLRWTQDNFALNGLDASLNISVERDARAFAAAPPHTYDGVIVDPPTAAQGAGKFWSIRRDFGPLLVSCFQALAPGGVMLVCRNDRRGRGSLDEAIRAGAKDAGVKLAGMRPAGPGPDYPSLAGFPEGDPFEGWLVQC
ncbi:MAG: class I SAM-dependent methyltransferase [Myxococcota bacterium]